MLEILFEHPVIVGAIGALTVAVAIFLWIQTAKSAALWTASGLLLATILAVWLSVSITTDRERLTQVLYDCASALQENDIDGVCSFIHPNAASGVQHARSELPRYEFSAARVTRIKDISVNDDTTPRTAIAQFNVYVEVNAMGQKFKVPRFVKVYFMLHNDEWRVHEYEHFDPQEGFRRVPLNGR